MSQRTFHSNDQTANLTSINNIEVSLIHLAKRLGKHFEASDSEVSVKVSGSGIEYKIISEGTKQPIDSHRLASNKKLKLLAEIGRNMLLHALEL